MAKNDYIKKMGQIYAPAIQKRYTEEELLQYTERTFCFLYLTENLKQIENVSTEKSND